MTVAVHLTPAARNAAPAGERRAHLRAVRESPELSAPSRSSTAIQGRGVHDDDAVGRDEGELQVAPLWRKDPRERHLARVLALLGGPWQNSGRIEAHCHGS